MTTEEIFANIATHKIKGMMIHDSLSNYYLFLGLNGYARCHEYHFICESRDYQKLNCYYIKHYNKLIPEKDVDSVKVIPDSWYMVSRFEVDAPTKKAGVKNALKMWHDWEKSTKALYETSYKELMNNGDVASAVYISGCIEDIDKELKDVEKYVLNKEAMDYDMASIISEQHHFKDKFKNKMRYM